MRAISIVLLPALLLAAACLAPAGGARAEEMIGPVYNPGTGSYFALVTRTDREPSWLYDKAAQAASARTWKGVRGRLAIVRDEGVHNFLVENFAQKLDTMALIGLRYWCNYRKLQWIDGSIQAHSDFGPWQRPYYRRRDITCSTQGRLPFMPVYYEPPGFEQRGAEPGRIHAMLWRSSGYKKGFHAYFVEFPTGKP